MDKRLMHNLYSEGYRVEVYTPNYAFRVQNPHGAQYEVRPADDFCECYDCQVNRNRCKHLCCLAGLVDDQIEAHERYARQIGRNLCIDRYTRRLLHMGAKPESVLSVEDARAWRELDRIEGAIDDLLDTYQATVARVEREERRIAA